MCLRCSAAPPALCNILPCRHHVGPVLARRDSKLRHGGVVAEVHRHQHRQCEPLFSFSFCLGPIPVLPLAVCSNCLAFFLALFRCPQTRKGRFSRSLLNVVPLAFKLSCSRLHSVPYETLAHRPFALSFPEFMGTLLPVTSSFFLFFSSLFFIYIRLISPPFSLLLAYFRLFVVLCWNALLFRVRV